MIASPAAVSAAPPAAARSGLPDTMVPPSGAASWREARSDRVPFGAGAAEQAEDAADMLTAVSNARARAAALMWPAAVTCDP
jgi:hypothetical protein